MRSLHRIEVESRADQFDEMLRLHFSDDLARTARRIDHIFGLGIGFVHTLDVEHQTRTVALDHHPADKLFERGQFLTVRQPPCSAQLCHGSRPRLQVIDGSNATGIINPITNLLTEGYAVLQRDDSGSAIVEAYFVEEYTVIYRNGRIDQVFEEEVPAPLLVPIIFRPDARRPFGHARISRACMDITESAMRTIKRSEITAEFYSFPQKYVVGLDPDAEQMDKWKATVSSLLQFDKDEDGDTPTLGQFQQQSMTPHLEQLKLFAGLFAGETGLTLDDLGFPTENPSSQEAIKAQHENLRLTARKAQRAFGSGFLNVGYLAACLRDDYQYYRYQVYMTEPTWEPVFEPDASTLSSIGDGAIKINQAVPGYFNADNLRDLTGIRRSDIPAEE